MKNGNPCPKCGAMSRIYRGGHRLTREAASWHDATALPYTRYICCGCGYSEDWYDPVALQQILSREEQEMREFDRDF